MNGATKLKCFLILVVGLVAAVLLDVPALAETPGGRALAREAQRLYRAGEFEAAARAYIEAAASTGRAARDFRFNAAVAALRAGDYRQAADWLAELDAEAARPDADIASGLGAALYRQAAAIEPAGATNLQTRADLLKSAAEAFRAAARAGDGDASRRNLAAVLGALPEAEQEARIAALLEQYGDAGPFRIADDMLRAQREINAAVPGATTNAVPDRIRELERLAAIQRETADLWIPLKGKLVEALAQQADTPESREEIGQLMHAMERTRDNMHATARVLRDNRPEGAEAAKFDEETVYRFWKGMAPSRPLLGEAIERQGRSLAAAADRDMMAHELAETLDLTQLFQRRFETEFPPEEIAPPDGTGAPPPGGRGLSEEDRLAIEAMTREAILSQQEAAEALERDIARSRDKQERSIELLSQILRMLPREEQEQRQDEQRQDEQRQEDPDRDESQPQESEPKQEEGDPGEIEPPDEPDPEEEPPEEEPEDQADARDDSTPEDVRELLRRALEREREHEARKRERERRLQSIPGERDW